MSTTMGQFIQQDQYDTTMQEVGSLFSFQATRRPLNSLNLDNETSRSDPPLKKHKKSPEPSSLFNVKKPVVYKSSNDSSSESQSHKYTYNPKLKIKSLFAPAVKPSQPKISNPSASFTDNNGVADYKAQYRYLKNMTNDKINYYLNFDFSDSDSEDAADIEEVPKEIELNKWEIDFDQTNDGF